MGLGKAAYVPPHLRHTQQAPAQAPVQHGYAPSSPVSEYVLSLPRNGWTDSRSHGPPPGEAPPLGAAPNAAFARGGFERSFTDSGRGAFGGGSRGGGNWSGNSGPRGTAASGDGARETFGFGVWRDGKHVAGGRNMRMEKELFGDAADPSKQHTGINFEKYDDIPVEATGADVPEAVVAFTNPPLDPVLLENIGYARYSTPTPVQKYSIPIVAGKRDLMACAQVSLSEHQQE